MKRVHIIGGGFSGLTLAWELTKQNIAVDLYEKSDRLGGMLGTRSSPQGLAETAANALIRTPAVENLFRELNLNPQFPLSSSKKRFIWRDRPQRWPLHLLESLSFAWKAIQTFGWKKRASAPQPNESVEHWGKNHLGEPATRYLLGPALQGIYAGDTRTMSASLILSPLFKRKKKYRGMISTEKGMAQLIEVLADRLRQKGVGLHLQSEFQFSYVKKDDQVVFACPPAAAADYLNTVAPDAAQFLSQIKMSSLISATAFFKQKQNDYQGFGCLIPRGHGLRTLGVLLNPFIFSGRDKTYNETFILGGATDPNIMDLSDEALIQLILTERQQIFWKTLEIDKVEITRWPNALPHYDLTLEKVLSKMKLPDKIHLHGNYLGGIGLSRILDRSIQLAQEIGLK